MLGGLSSCLWAFAFLAFAYLSLLPCFWRAFPFLAGFLPSLASYLAFIILGLVFGATLPLLALATMGEGILLLVLLFLRRKKE